VEVVYGRPDDEDEIVSPNCVALSLGGDEPQSAPQTPPDHGGAARPLVPAAGGLLRYSGEISLDQPGSFGYTVRVLPRHPLLDSRAELGLVTYPHAPAGMTNGDLR
jgi:starch phosphorylase